MSLSVIGTGFGRTGPYADVKGYEGVVMAKLGGFQLFHQMATLRSAARD